MPLPHALTRGAALAIVSATLAACGGGGDSTAPTPTGPDLAARSAAATATAQGSNCASIQPFYWEIGDKTQKLAGASVTPSGSAQQWDATSRMNIASASKWLYGAYVAERRAGALTAEDIKYLNFQSGYTNFGFSGCDPTDTVASCVARASNGVQDAATIDKFYYNGGHMQKHASLAAPGGMNLGALDNAAIAAEMRRLLGSTINLTYTQPQLAGGAVASANDYAVFLRKLLNNQLQMASLLGNSPVCTNPLNCATSVYTPTPSTMSWHYSIGHWVEDGGAVADGAFSSPGAFGFYPWVDAGKTTYGIVAREVLAGYRESAACGALIRNAWMTATAQ